MVEIAVIATICILSYVLILRNLDFAVYVLILLSVLLHKELFSFYRWDLMPIRAFMLALLAAVLTKIVMWLIKDRNFSVLFSKLRDPVVVSIVLLWVVRLISIVNSKNIQSSVFLMGFFTTSTAMFLLLYFTYKNRPDRVLKYLRFYIYTVFTLTLFGWFQFYLYQTTGVIIGALWNIPGNLPRVGATFWDVNHYGALLSALLPLLGVLIIMGKSLKGRAVDVLMFISMLAALLLTNSRTAWIMAGVTFLVFVSTLIFRKIGSKGVLYLFIALVVISVPFIREYSIKSSPFRAQIKQYFHYRMDSFDSHFMLITGTVQIFEKYPLIGGGYGSFFEHFSSTKIAPTFFGRDPAALNTRVPAHTIWGELIAETGILGLTTFSVFVFSMLAALLYGALKLEKKKEFLISAVFFATIVGWLIAGIFYSYSSEFFWIIFSFIAAWGAGTVYEKYGRNIVFSYFFRSEKIVPLVLAGLAIILIFSGLGKNHLIPYDEAIYAKIAKNMVTSGEYLVQEWKPLSVWYEKPPLYMWLVSLFMSLFGATPFAARLPSAVMGFLTVMMVYFAGKKMFNKTTGFLSALALLTTTQYLYYSRAAMTDVTATFFISASLFAYIFIRGKKKSFLWLFPGFFAGFAVMTKGVVGLLPFPAIILCELYLLLTGQSKFSAKAIKPLILTLLGWAVVALPWHIYTYKMFGTAFLDQYLGYHVWDRAVTAIEDKGRPFFWYVTVLKVSMRLWFVVLLAALPAAVYKVFKKRRVYVFLLVWALFVFFFFSSAKSKLVWYVMPMYPPLALIVGSFIDKTLNYFMRRFRKFDTLWFKATTVFLVTAVSLSYLFYYRELVYTSDLTGAEAELLISKDARFGIKTKVYIDRMDIPLAMYYTDGSFNILDFRADRYDRVPIPVYDQPTVLLTKKGRFSENVVGFNYKPVVVEERGDWVLWYFISQKEYDSRTVPPAVPVVANP
ncbi:MAG: Glycosyl transferase, family 39 [uncultured bacterium]|uniref:Phospholipid carrier-dependent glycosyltransferase n=1 Tax=candidate division WWE3 bacterium TaxID=2053526 RepID=A0A656PLW2_UNCKA|nr:Glycosyl transferase family 39 [candidate division WWE3 bacterium RAAC2_WWE3_1]EKD95093.1 MAG: Glycosyl transferase, family 39 [uncultured bacterium]KKS30180.1 MAG: Glycosyl transferase family 39 [candidate division WWE3 bacterium GW2011_GWB1_42_117]KKS55227.1 MAG: Glycosyl transferase family 39 [candidate division WWE3 bacterium GW2011_GWD2_42_34]KKT05780.1 MAG: Glycosyl transferase family 39 [candidate division WWE3 bacterium GW2011_GWE2_43_18]KKT07330.1 MAG: Glycosyl transferase family 3